MKILAAIIFCLALVACSRSIGTSRVDTTYIVQPGPNTGKDAEVWNLDPNTYYAQKSGLCDTTNLGDEPFFRAADWTYFGDEATHRSYIQFDIHAIPQSSKIDSAFLYLYNDPSFGDFQSGENALYIKPVLEPWDESKIMWFNQPEVLKDTSQYKFIYVPKSKYKTQNYKIDITSLMKYWVEDQHPNYGMQIRLVKESLYADAFFASSEDSNAALRPKLKVYYNVAQYRFITNAP